MKKDYLINFEDEIAKLYESGKIKSPIHLSGGNEDQLIEIFKSVKKNDWVFSTWRNHYHALLKSKDPEWLKGEILKGRSLHINSKKHKIFTSSIVGGIIPIALGVALALKRKKSKNRVWCFIGDMSAETGSFNEAMKYARGFNLPITYIIEDNGISVYTPTNEVWGKPYGKGLPFASTANLIYYTYERKWPHWGIGKFINF
jgi:pyruvate dehydrogenase E1 component alpha subunit